jgi:hypothetical protein
VLDVKHVGDPVVEKLGELRAPFIGTREHVLPHKARVGRRHRLPHGHRKQGEG